VKEAIDSLMARRNGRTPYEIYQALYRFLQEVDAPDANVEVARQP